MSIRSLIAATVLGLGLAGEARAVAVCATTTPQGCGACSGVRFSGGPVEANNTIQGGVNTLLADGPLTSNSCVVVMDSASFNEEVIVEGFVNNGFRLTIMKSPGAGGSVSMSPSAGSAAFVIKNASVTIQGFDILKPGGPVIPYGITASSAYVHVASVTVTGGGSNISVAGVRLSSWSAVSHTTVSVSNAHGLLLEGEFNTVDLSSASADNPGKYALFLSGASSNTVARSDFSTPAGRALGIDNGSNFNVVKQCAMTAGFAGLPLFLAGSSSNTVMDSMARSAAGDAGSIGGTFNRVLRSTFTTNESLSYYALVIGGSDNLADQVYAENTSGNAVQIGGIRNTLSRSTVTTSGAFRSALDIRGSSNTATGVRAHTEFGNGALFSNGSYNTFAKSTATSKASNYPALYFGPASSWNKTEGSYLENTASTAVFFGDGTSFNTLSQSTAVCTGTLGTAVVMSGVSSNTISGSWILGRVGQGLRIEGGQWNTVSQSTVIGGASAGLHALGIKGSSGNVVTGSYVESSNGDALKLFGGAVFNTVTQTSLVIGPAPGAAVYAVDAASNTISGSYVTGGFIFSNNAYANRIDQSTVAATGIYAGTFSGASSNTVSGSYLSGAVDVLSGSAFNVLSQSTLTRTSASPVLTLNGASSNTITGSFIRNPAGAAVAMNGGAYGNTVVRSTAVAAAAGSAVQLSGVSANTLSKSYFYASGAPALHFLGNGYFNQVVLSTAVSGSAGFNAVVLADSSSNTFSGSWLLNPSGPAVSVTNNANGNTFSQSTIAAAGTGLYVKASTALVSECYLEGSTAVSLDNATGTVVTASFLAGQGASGVGLRASNRSYNVVLATSIVSGGVQGTGVLLGADNRGELLVASNTILPQARYGLFAENQGAGASLKILSNLIIPAVTSAQDSYGLYLNGLAAGATVENNIFAWRTSGSMGAFTGYGAYARATPSLSFKHNRVSNPGMITGGSVAGLALDGSVSAEIEFNDFHSTGAAANSVLAEFRGVAGGLRMKANVFFASMTVTGSSYTLRFAQASADVNHQLDYNNYFSSNSRNSVFWGGAAFELPLAWYQATGQDRHSRSVHPLWVEPGAGVEDFHPRSAGGRFNPALGAFSSDGATAQTIDGAHPAAPFSRETSQNGSRANMGSYGNTEEASRSVAQVFSKLQILMPGETADPDTITGRAGAPQNVYQNTFFQVTVRGTDDFWNAVPTASDQVKLTTAAPFNTNNIPQTATLAAGVTVFTSVSFGATGSGVVLIASNTASASMPVAQTLPFSVVPVAAPAVGINIPNGSIRATLGGSVSGNASDGVAVSTVVIAIQRKNPGSSAGLFWDWGLRTFTAATPLYGGGTLTPPNGASVSWSVPFLDSDLADYTSYYIIAKASNSAQLSSIAQTTFTFNSQFAVKRDGEGTAVVLPNQTEGCQPIISTVIFTVGASSITTGGMFAVRIPDDWTRPQARKFVDPNGPLLLPGDLTVGGPGVGTVDLNPARVGNTTLGDNWIAVNAGSKMFAGDQIFLTYKGFPPNGGLAKSSQTFAVMSRAGPDGTLVSITTAPAFSLTPGGARRIAFSPAEQISVGPLQTSPTMQITVTDACGVSTVAPSALIVSLSAGNFGSLDANTSFYASGSGAEILSRQVSIGALASASPGFYYRTSTSGVSFELLKATAALGGTVVEAYRGVRLFSSSITLSAVSVDSGTLAPGALSATMTGNTFLAPSFVNFKLSEPTARWEVIISSSYPDFYPEVFHRFGAGDSGRNVSWNGINERIVPPRSMPPGTYRVKILVEGGAVADQRGQIYISTNTGSIYGTVNSTGASAGVVAFGPGSHFGHYAAASATGYFQIHGLDAGKVYNVEASTAVLDPIYKRFARLTVSSLSVTAAAGGVDIGTIPFQAPSSIRVAAGIATLAPRELFGRVKAFNSDYSQTAFGTLHFSSGTSSSDDGGESFGGSASTWTTLSVLGGTYDLEIQVAELGLSTTVKSITVAGGAAKDLVVNLDRKANLYGYAVLPGTVSYGSWVSVQGARAGEAVPRVFGGAFIPGPAAGVNPTSATYSLFGLSPGSWTISARTFGFVGVSSAVYISSDADVGNSSSGGFDLFLSSGGVLKGTVTVVGNTVGMGAKLGGAPGGSSFDLFLNAGNPATFSKASVRIRMSENAAATSSTFSLSGLDNGTQFLTAHLPGFVDLRSTVAVAGGVASANLFLRPNDARVIMTLRLPSGTNYPPSEFAKVSGLIRGPGIAPFLRSNLMGANTVQYFPSSATWQSPPLAAGVFTVEALYGPTGMFQIKQVALTQGATATLDLDLGGSTYTVRGTVSLSGNVSFSSANYSVNVSSIAGLLANAGATNYCLMGSSLPVTTTTFHMELIPANPLFGGFLSGPLFRAQPGNAACFSPFPSNELGQNSPNPFHGYIAEVSTTGAFTFKGIPPGLYMLRNNAEIDNNTANGDELPQLRSFLTVSSDTVLAALQLDAGFSVSGQLMAPPQTLLSRPFRVSLLDSAGNVQRTLVTSFNNSPQAKYYFDRVAAGAYSVRVEDQGYPRAYAARPRSVKVQAFNLAGEDISLEQGGIVKGKLAIQQRLPDGTTGPLQLITGQSAGLLPKNFQVLAVANPWFQGGFAQANPKNCGGNFCGGVGFDAADQFVIENLLPGTYDVKFVSRNNSEDTLEGGINLVSSFAPGVKIDEGKVTDIGVVKLSAALDLRGKVTAAGAAVANAKVEARPSIRQASDQDRINAVTDKDGGYLLSGLDPRIRYYDVVAAARGSGEQGEPLLPFERKVAPSVDLSSTTSLDFALTAAPYSIKGKVAAAAGSAALTIPFGDAGRTRPGAEIFLNKSGNIPTETPIGDIILRTDRDGNFELSALTAGSYKLTVLALNHGSVVRNVTIADASIDLGTLTLSAGGSLSGTLKKPDGSSPSSSEIVGAAAATADFSEIVEGSLVVDPNTRTATEYAISGFKAGLSYRLLLIDSKGVPFSPEGASAVVFTSTETRTLDVVYRSPKPSVFAKAKRKSDGTFKILVETSQPFRAKTAADDSLSLLLSTYSAKGALSEFELGGDRSRLSAIYTPGGGETTFSLRVNGYSAVADPDSLEGVNPEFPLRAITTFYVGLDGAHQNAISNFSGGNLIVEGDNGRVTMPAGAFSVDASSSVDVALRVSSESLSKQGVTVTGFRTNEEKNIASLRFAPSAYPESLLRAMAATPPEISPFSAFYDILLPLGIRTALSKPVQMTISYSSGTDPTTVNLYWYNTAANAYILQQDVTGAPPVIDYENRTITINVNHFSTFVMFQTNVNVITGDTFGASEMEAFAFPNPFDLTVKTVQTIHPVANHTVRGTMIRFSLPLSVSGEASLRIYTLSGERIRTIELGTLAKGQHYYQAWDGRNDSGRDVASGVYMGQIRVGKHGKFFKMAVIK